MIALLALDCVYTPATVGGAATACTAPVGGLPLRWGRISKRLNEHRQDKGDERWT